MPFLTADEVQTPMDAVGKINIRPPGRTKHHRIARRLSRKTMRSRFFAVIRLCLDDHTTDAINEQLHANQLAGDIRGIAPEVDSLPGLRQLSRPRLSSETQPCSA